MLRRLASALLVMLLQACSRDLTVPGPPAPGTVQGRVVYAVPGLTAPKAAAGASVSVLGTSLGTTTAADGRFLVEGITTDHGSLLVQADLDGDGKPDRQALLSLAGIHAGLGRNVALGDLSILENGSIHGRVSRADVPSATTGQGGTVVFVPQGPYTTYTGDDGSWRLDNLPAGSLSLTFFRDHYAPQGVDGIALRSGEDFPVGEITLHPSTGGGTVAQRGALSGQLIFSPVVGDASAATVEAFPLAGDPLPATVSAGGAFSFASVPAGLYRLEAALTGYSRAVAPNVFVGAGAQVVLAIALARGGVTITPPPVGPPPGCVAGARCDLPNPCQVGQVTCAGGSPFCGTIGNALDGIPCGPNLICSAGSCIAVCVGGASCRPPADPCKQGTVSCSSGAARCVAGADTMPDGTPCGHDQVCSAGACVGCVSGALCAGANPCHSGLTDCSTGTQVCKDSGLALADGSPCGSNLYCNAGACGACTPGEACDPPGFPCHVGAASCATGRPVCADLGSARPNGRACGKDQVCFAGGCNACAAGQDCAPANPCHVGAIGCASGQPACVDQQVNQAPGASCGTGQVCDGLGGCISCAQGQPCVPANPCHAGALGCGTGAPVCADLGTGFADGTSCGAGKVCFQGACNACQAGSSCTPANPCHFGTTGCSTGQPVCADSGSSLGDGVTCGPSQVCFHGTCGPCAGGAACDGAPGHAGPPAGSDPCKVYGTLCTSGAPVCGVLQNQADGTPCGTGLICRGGTCQASSLQIVAASGANQHALPNQPLAAPLVIQVMDVTISQGKAGQQVSITPPPGAQAIPPSATTDASGNASFTLTLGRAIGAQAFTVGVGAAFPSTASVTETADPPGDGTIIPLVNAGHVLGNTGIGGPGPVAQNYNVTGIAVASTGEVYFADGNGCQVKKLSPEGVVTLVAGGVCGFGGDSGAATSARLSGPRGLALDEEDGVLYVADLNNSRVRMIDLAGGLIDTVAGSGDFSSLPPYGDGGSARSAQIGFPASVALGSERPNPSLYVTDYAHSRIRRVDGTTGIITSVVSPGPCTAPGIVVFDLASSSEYTASVAVDGEGSLFLSGRFCGTQLGGTPTYGIGRLRPDGSLALVAGEPSGGLSGGSALGAGFAESPILAFDNASAAGGARKKNLFFAVNRSHAVGRIDGASGRLEIIAGTVDTVGGGGDFGSASSARLSSPFGLAFAPGGRDLFVADEGNGAVRMIAGAGSQSASTASFAISGGAPPPSYVDQFPPLPLSVALKDGAGNGLAGYPVRFALDPARLPGGWVSNAVAQTSLAGVAAVTGRPGLAVGKYGVIASFDDIHGDPIPGSPVSFELNAVAPPAGTVFTAVNDSHQAGTTALQGGPGTTLTIYQPLGLAASSDGTVYFSDAVSHIYRMDPAGLVTLVGGSGATGYSGDGGPAVAAGMRPYGLWLDQPSNTLYFADLAANRVRAIDLASGNVGTVAGSNPASPPPNYGDGGLAVNAAVSTPTRVAVVGGYLYLGEISGGNRLRRVKLDPDPASRTIDSLLQAGASRALQTSGFASSCASATVPTFWQCYNDPGCAVAADPSGRLYVSGVFCGPQFNDTGGSTPSAVSGIVRIEADNTLTRVAGLTNHSLGTGTSAGLVGFGSTSPPMIRFDGAGDLWIAWGTQIGYFAPGVNGVDTSSVFTQVGTGPAAAPQPGQYQTSSQAFFPAPVDLAFLPGGHVVVGDGLAAYPSYSLRIIW
jgi:sugar lactone lactonase YvrE